ncbi:hypothetical protein BGX26_007330 [Mortierella sp. AD094]|nr:hypothetical protein BGX26_007330 [Mortierella sp. AD094]
MDRIIPRFLGYRKENDLNIFNKDAAAETLMVYISRSGTWTPAHFDHCGAIGHNIMISADKGSYAIWFVIKPEHRQEAEDLWRSFGQNLEYEDYLASVEDLQNATFPIYVVEQKIGDLVMVPSLSYHQVINLGKMTIKVAWNRLTTNCLKTAINIVLPRYKEGGSNIHQPNNAREQDSNNL